jgi:hypothetical protein
MQVTPDPRRVSRQHAISAGEAKCRRCHKGDIGGKSHRIVIGGTPRSRRRIAAAAGPGVGRTAEDGSDETEQAADDRDGDRTR